MFGRWRCWFSASEIRERGDLPLLRVANCPLEHRLQPFINLGDHVVGVVVDRVLLGPLPKPLVDVPVVSAYRGLRELEVIELKGVDQRHGVGPELREKIPCRGGEHLHLLPRGPAALHELALKLPLEEAQDEVEELRKLIDEQKMLEEKIRQRARAIDTN